MWGFSPYLSEIGASLVFMAGCSTLPPPNPPPSSSLPTDFSPDSPVGELWSDIQTELHRENKDLSGIEASIDRGYDEYALVIATPNIVNKSGILEPQEVLRFAYSDQRFYSTIRRHHFPLPFASDESDSLSKGYRADLDRIIVQAKEGMPSNLAIGSDSYRLELGQRIYLGLRKITDTFKDNCPLELDAWAAYDKKCGACSEKSSILYEAYERAKIGPVFLAQHQFRLPISQTVDLVESPDIALGHIMVGLPLASGKTTIADLALHRFGVEEPLASKVDPSFAAMGHLMNRVVDLDKSMAKLNSAPKSGNGDALSRLAKIRSEQDQTLVLLKNMTHSCPNVEKLG